MSVKGSTGSAFNSVFAGLTLGLVAQVVLAFDMPFAAAIISDMMDVSFAVFYSFADMFMPLFGFITDIFSNLDSFVGLWF
ncbi:MAG: hypothetical protein M0Z59_03985 [Nitrospiraceae bacterium]|nr:hypothetical protein [Nitrospiraceae bacterium]